MHRFGRGEPPVDFEKVASKCSTWGDFLEYDVLGGVAAKPNITAAAQRRAEETIRVFNLDQSARLRGSRRQVGETINCLLSSNPTQEEIVSFLDSVRSFEYFSVYCSLLGHYVPIPKTSDC